MAKTKKSSEKAVRHLPFKKSLNVANIEQKKIDAKISIPAIVLVIVAAFALGKFGVADRLMKVSRAESEVAALEEELDASYAKLDSYGELNELYAHYTYSGMTKEEAKRPDRASAIEMIRRVIMPKGDVTNWTLSGDLLTVSFSCENLNTAKSIAQDLETDPHVNFCSVSTAATLDKNRRENEDNGITARLMIYLNPAEEVARP